MAGDWLKVEHDLPDKPEVIAIATAIEMDRFAVVGRLVKLWMWFDRHTKDGCASGVTPKFLDTLVSHDGFAAAMTSVGWLRDRNGRISVPNFDRHISKSAKRRALASERMKLSRYVSSATEAQPEEEEVALSLTHRHSDTGTPTPLPENFDWDGIRGDCNKLQSMVRPRSQQDLDLLVKAVVLSRTVFDSEWLWTAATGAKRKKQPDQFRYLHGALRGKAKDRGRNFNLLLKQIDIPETFRPSSNGEATP